jgi:hypothetical protein
LKKNVGDENFIKGLVSHPDALRLMTTIINDCSDAEAHSHITATLFMMASEKNALLMLIEEEIKSEFRNITPLRWLTDVLSMLTSTKVWAEDTYITEESVHPTLKNYQYTKTYLFPLARYIRINFDPMSDFTNSSLTFSGEDEIPKQITNLSGDRLHSVTIAGSKLTIHFTTNNEKQAWGYRFDISCSYDLYFDERGSVRNSTLDVLTKSLSKGSIIDYCIHSFDLTIRANITKLLANLMYSSNVSKKSENGFDSSKFRDEGLMRLLESSVLPLIQESALFQTVNDEDKTISLCGNTSFNLQADVYFEVSIVSVGHGDIQIGLCETIDSNQFCCRRGHPLRVVNKDHVNLEGIVDTCKFCHKNKLCTGKDAAAANCTICSETMCFSCTQRECNLAAATLDSKSYSLKGKLQLGQTIGVLYVASEKRVKFSIDGDPNCQWKVKPHDCQVDVSKFVKALRPYANIVEDVGITWNFGQGLKNFKYPPSTRFQSFMESCRSFEAFGWEVFDSSLAFARPVDMAIDKFVKSDETVRMEAQKLFYNNKRQIARGFYGALEWATSSQLKEILQATVSMCNSEDASTLKWCVATLRRIGEKSFRSDPLFYTYLLNRDVINAIITVASSRDLDGITSTSKNNKNSIVSSLFDVTDLGVHICRSLITNASKAKAEQLQHGIHLESKHPYVEVEEVHEIFLPSANGIKIVFDKKSSIAKQDVICFYDIDPREATDLTSHQIGIDYGGDNSAGTKNFPLESNPLICKGLNKVWMQFATKKQGHDWGWSFIAVPAQEEDFIDKKTVSVFDDYSSQIGSRIFESFQREDKSSYASVTVDYPDAEEVAIAFDHNIITANQYAFIRIVNAQDSVDPKCAVGHNLALVNDDSSCTGWCCQKCSIPQQKTKRWLCESCDLSWCICCADSNTIVCFGQDDFR